MTTKRVGYRFTEEVAEALEFLAIRRGVDRTQVVSDLILDAARDPLYGQKIQELTIVDTDPFIVSGQKWEGVFTGIVRIYYPRGAKVPSIDVAVDNMDFKGFTNMLAANYEDLQQLFDPS